MKPSPRTEASTSLSPVVTSLTPQTPAVLLNLSVNADLGAAGATGVQPMSNGHSPRDSSVGVSGSISFARSGSGSPTDERSAAEKMEKSSPPRLRFRTASSPSSSSPPPPIHHRLESASTAAGEGASSVHWRREAHDGDGGEGSSTRNASPSRQLNKLKRFLATLQHLGADISPEIGDSVHTLVLALVNNAVSIEEFHDQLHKTTNFPLRPFVVPFLKSSLPILQQELKELAQHSHMSPSQFLIKNEHILFDIQPNLPSDSPGPPRDPGSSRDLRARSPFNDNGKRPFPSENGGTNGLHNGDVIRPAKCVRMRSPPAVEDATTLGFQRDALYSYGVRPIRLQDISTSRLIREQLERERLLQERDRYFSVYSMRRPDVNEITLDRREDEWKHLENILHCIAGMVENCQRALLSLQERSSLTSARDDLHVTMRRRTIDGLTSNSGSSGGGPDIKRDILTSSLRHTVDADPRLDIIRKAEDAVKEVKRQAVSELQKAVAAAEAKTNEILTVDRLKMERSLEEVRQRTRDEVTSLLNRQEESKENCWNCGRLASETCSGCNEARYCGSFCQHRHWETHHRVCGRTHMVAPSTSSSLSSSSSTSSVCRTNTTLQSLPSTSALLNNRQYNFAPALSSVPAMPIVITRPVTDLANITKTGLSSSNTELILPIIKQEKM